MTDHEHHGAPQERSPRPAPIVAPPAGGPTPPGSPHWSPPQNAAPRPGYGPAQHPGQPGWAPPPKPGLIPLAPLTFGTILGAPYRLFRKNPRPTFGVSLLIYAAIFVITLLVVGLVAWASFRRVDFASSNEDVDLLVAGALGTTLLSTLIPIALSIISTGVMQGIVVLEVSRQTLGEKLTFPSLWARGRGRLWAVAGYSLLLVVALVIALIVVVVIGLVPLAFGDGAIAVSIILTILLYLGLFLGVLAITTKLAFVPSAIVLERLSIGAAIARSWTLTRRAFWRTLGIILLVAVIFGIASQAITIPVNIILTIGLGVFAPTGDVVAVIVTVLITVVLFGVASLVIGAISLVVQSATSALLYIDQRVRKEGLDLDLMRFVEARQSGATELRDPYEPGTSRPTA